MKLKNQMRKKKKKRLDLINFFLKKERFKLDLN